MSAIDEAIVYAAAHGGPNDRLGDAVEELAALRAEAERLRVLVSRLRELPAWWVVHVKSGPVCLWCRAPATWPDGNVERAPDCDHVGRCPVPGLDEVTT
jgi:hypothetical protein